MRAPGEAAEYAAAGTGGRGPEMKNDQRGIAGEFGHQYERQPKAGEGGAAKAEQRSGGHFDKGQQESQDMRDQRRNGLNEQLRPEPVKVQRFGQGRVSKYDDEQGRQQCPEPAE